MKKPVNKIITNPFEEPEVSSNNTEETVPEIIPETALPKTNLIDVNPVDRALNAVYWMFFVLAVMMLLIGVSYRDRFYGFVRRRKDD